MLAAYGDEQLAFAYRSRVGGHAVESPALVAVHKAGAHGCDGFGEAHHRPLRRPSAAPATAASENGSRRPAISWKPSWPLPAISTTSAAAADSMAESMALARSSSTVQTPEIPVRMASMIASGSSPRGL